MNEIKCPKCGTVFQINEEDYESISKQIRDIEFNKELDLHKKHVLEQLFLHFFRGLKNYIF